MISEFETCPSCGVPSVLTPYAHTVRRGDRFVQVTWSRYVCHSGCLAERTDEPYSFVTMDLGERNRIESERAWMLKYGDEIPPPGRAGRPHRAGAPSSERVPVLFTSDELEDIDRRRGGLSRSAFVRQAVLGQHHR